MPSGFDLKRSIVDLLAEDPNQNLGFGDDRLERAIANWIGDTLWHDNARRFSLAQAAGRICRGLPLAVSIDNFLHSHQHDTDLVTLGKLCIAIRILEAERHSKMFTRGDISQLANYGRMHDILTPTNTAVLETWYLPLAQLLMAGVSKENIEACFENVSFVIFNYDRCLEEFLLHAVQQYFDVSEERAAAALEAATFIHPYGSLGPLPWQTAQASTSLPLGRLEESDLYAVSTNIKTFTQSVESDVDNAVKYAISYAKTIVILGFGFLQQNVNLLEPVNGGLATKVISSAFGLSHLDQAMVRTLMTRLATQEIIPDLQLDAGTCRQLFDHFRVTLSFA